MKCNRNMDESSQWLKAGSREGLSQVKTDGGPRGESCDREDGWSEENDKCIHADVLPGKLFPL